MVHKRREDSLKKNGINPSQPGKETLLAIIGKNTELPETRPPLLSGYVKKIVCLKIKLISAI